VRLVHRPGKRRSKLLVAAAIVLAVALVSTLTVHRIAFLLYAEQFVADLRIVLLPAEPQHPDVVIVSLTEDTLAMFPYREPVDRGFLADLLGRLESRGPRAIAMDILLDQPTEFAKDARLRRAIADATVPLSVSYVDDPAIVNEDQKAFLDAFVPPADRALANFSEDPFDTARWIFPGRATADLTYVPGFARAIAAKLGIATPAQDVEIAWRGSPPEGDAAPFRQFPAHTVALLPTEWFKDEIVLIGADYSIIDRHRTPFAAVYEGTKGFLPGIVIHAQWRRSAARPSPALRARHLGQPRDRRRDGLPRRADRRRRARGRDPHRACLRRGRATLGRRVRALSRRRGHDRWSPRRWLLR
jgi:adenylate cyclase